MKKQKDTKAFLDELKQFLPFLSELDATELEWESDGYGVKLSRRVAPFASPQASLTPNGKARPQEELTTVNSPVVGTFHFFEEKPLPGDKLASGQILGYIQAINVEHPIEASEPGLLSEIHVEEGQVVEFGQVLFTVVDSLA